MSAAEVIPYVELEQKAETWTERASQLAVTSQAELESVASFLQGIKALRIEIADTFDEPTKRAHEAHKSIVAARKKVEQPLIEAEQLAKQKAGSYVAEQERKARAEAALAEAAAREVREKAEREARELEAAGEAELADAIREESHVTAAPIQAAPKPKASGVATRAVWKARVKSLRELVAAVHAGKVPLEALKADDVVIGQAARALKKSLDWPGVETWEETQVATR